MKKGTMGSKQIQNLTGQILLDFNGQGYLPCFDDALSSEPTQVATLPSEFTGAALLLSH